MKKLILVMVALIAIALVTAIAIDSKLYYYGKNAWNIHEKLPLKITPNYLGYGKGNSGFALMDEDEMTLIARGNKYWSSGIEVNEIIKYGFNKQKLVALVNDSLGNFFYIECSKNNAHSKQDIKIAVLEKSAFLNSEKIKWIDVKNAPTYAMEITRNYLLIFSIIIFLIVAYFILVRKKHI
ncbi:hypothetical protein [Flavihumibacter profundi]|uniref:hypothetical protein n=1 Tax=Flavihumibacter profundi TaxID=2716883 RepID=UPI001CC64A8E|nr:hypothetical protein [Flavihumibacter profundi]MBZ5857190.1 hypothetical protein [Flavihumibacter profundi]